MLFFSIGSHTDEHPASPDFVPLERRSPIEQARWWALMSKRIGRRERALYSRSEDAKFREVSFDLWRMLKEADNGKDA